MKATSKKLALSILLSTLGLSSMPRQALAVWSMDTLHGTACKPYGNSNVSGLQSGQKGVYNTTAFTLSVMCPVLRTEEVASTGYRVYVNGSALAGRCWLYSQSATGNTLRVQGMTGASDGRRVTSVLAAADAPALSSQAVRCDLAPGTWIYNLEFVQ